MFPVNLKGAISEYRKQVENEEEDELLEDDDEELREPPPVPGPQAHDSESGAARPQHCVLGTDDACPAAGRHQASAFSRELMN
jgi:hypothetical protein